MTVTETNRRIRPGCDRTATVRSLVLLGAATAGGVASSTPRATAQQVMTRITETAPIRGNSYSARDVTGGSMAASADGLWIAFDSSATNLVTNDVNGHPDAYGYANVFLQNTTTGEIVRITSGNGQSWDPVLSEDGRFVAFLSLASSFVFGDTNTTADVFVHDRDPDGNGVFDEGNGVTTRVSLSSTGNEIHGDCFSPAISRDGTKVVFVTKASDVVSGDTNGSNDAFLRDLKNGTTTRVSVSTSGAQLTNGADMADLSADGSTVAFESDSSDVVSGDTNNANDVFIYDVGQGKTVARASVGAGAVQANGDSTILTRCLSSDGSIVAFTSTAANLVANDTNLRSDVFIRNLTTGVTSLASVTTGGVIGNWDSLDATLDAAGDRVAFHSGATNFDAKDVNGIGVYDVYVHDFVNGTTTLVSADPSGFSGDLLSSGGVIAPAGDVVVFDSEATTLVRNDSNGFRDVFARDLANDGTTMVSIVPARPMDGVYSGTTQLWDGDCDVSANGRWVTFASYATNLAAPDAFGRSNVFVKDLETGAVVLVSQFMGADGNGDSFRPTISSDGRFVCFTSAATNWISLGAPYYYVQTNVYVCDRDPDGNGIFDEGNSTLELASWTAGPGSVPGNTAGYSSISGSGRYVAFMAYEGWNYDPRCDTNAYYRENVFLRDRQLGRTTLLSVSSSGSSDGNNDSGSPAFSANDTTIVFHSYASDLLAADGDSNLDVYAYDVPSGKLALVSVDSNGVKQKASAFIGRRAVSSDGSLIVFACNDPNFNPVKTTSYYDVYLRDRSAGSTADISMVTNAPFAADCLDPAISRDGEFVTWSSTADNQLAGDSNHAADIFWYDRYGYNSWTCASTNGAYATGDSFSVDPVALDYPGKVAFASNADNLVHDDANAAVDLFLFDPTAAYGRAEWMTYGAGFPGTFGVPSFDLLGDPILGATTTLLLGNSRHANTSALLLVSPRPGSITTKSGATWLVDLSSIFALSLVVPAPGLRLDVTMPSDPALAATPVYLQAIEADPGATRHFSFTRGLELYFQLF